MIPTRYRLTAGLATMCSWAAGCGGVTSPSTNAAAAPMDFFDSDRSKPDADVSGGLNGACASIEDLRE